MDDRLATIDMSRKLGAGLIPIEHNVAWTEAYLRTTGAMPLWGELGPHLTQSCLDGGLIQYQVAS